MAALVALAAVGLGFCISAFVTTRANPDDTVDYRTDAADRRTTNDFRRHDNLDSGARMLLPSAAHRRQSRCRFQPAR